MKNIIRKKVVIGVMIAIIIVLFAFSMAAVRLTKLTPCKDEPGHFKDDSGNGYCIDEELIQDFKNNPVLVMEDSG